MEMALVVLRNNLLSADGLICPSFVSLFLPVGLSGAVGGGLRVWQAALPRAEFPLAAQCCGGSLSCFLVPIARVACETSGTALQQSPK